MRATWVIVLRREILAKLSDRAFLVGTTLTLALIAAILGVNAYLATRSDDFRVVATSDAMPMATALADQAADLREDTTLSVEQVSDAQTARAQVSDGLADGWLHRAEPADTGWVLTTHSDEAGLFSLTRQVVADEVVDQRARDLGTTADALRAGSTLSPDYLTGDADRGNLAQAVGFVFAFLFYIATLMFGMQIASSVVEEKQSRIVEIIAASIPVRHLLAGKVAGNTVLAMAQMVLYVAVGLIGLSFTPWSRFVPALTGSVAWYLVFFLAGFVALACLWAVAGSLGSRTEDLQTTTTPLTLLMMTVFFAGLLLDGTAKVVGSFIPPLSAILMPMRLVEGDVPLWQPLVALALLAAFAGVAIIFGERLYRRSLLQTGGRVSLRHAWSTPQ